MPQSTARRVAVLALLLAMVGLPASAAGWRVAIDGGPILGGASVELRGATLWVDLAAAAPALGLQLLELDRVFALRASDGVLWRLSSDGTRLESPGRSLVLNGAVRGFADRPFLPVAALAMLASRRLELDRAARVARLVAADAPADAGAPDGWEPLRLPKPPEQLAAEAEARRIASLAAPGLELIAPESHGTLHVGLGVGHLLDRDWGTELSASGSIAGLAVALDALASTGSAGSTFERGRLVVGAGDRRWTIEAGDLYGELTGAVRGLRLSSALGSHWRVDLAVVEPSFADSTGERALLGLRFAPGDRGALVEAELDSVGGGFARARLERPRSGAALFARRRPDLEQESVGASVRRTLGRRLQVAAGASVGNAAGVRSEDWSASLGAWLGGRRSLALERSSSALGERRLDSSAVALFLGLGPIRWSARLERLELGDGATRSQRDRLAITAAAPLAAGFDLAYQGYLGLDDDVEPWDELALRATLTPRTWLEVAAPVAGGELDERLRVRLTQQLGDSTALVVESGRLAPFSSRPLDDSDLGDDRGVRVLVRTSWDLRTPAGGGAVAGRLVDSSGRAVPGVPVRLGDYRTLSERDGRWRFDHVPRGDYELAVEESGLVGRYVARAPAAVEVRGRAPVSAELEVLERVAIEGLVCIDRDRDRLCGWGEEIADVPVEVAGRVTTTDVDGRFVFERLPPGRHVVRLIHERLADGLAPVGPTELELDIRPGRRAGGLLFLLEQRQRPIVFGSLP